MKKKIMGFDMETEPVLSIWAGSVRMDDVIILVDGLPIIAGEKVIAGELDRLKIRYSVLVIHEDFYIFTYKAEKFIGESPQTRQLIEDAIKEYKARIEKEANSAQELLNELGVEFELRDGVLWLSSALGKDPRRLETKSVLAYCKLDNYHAWAFEIKRARTIQTVKVHFFFDDIRQVLFDGQRFGVRFGTPILTAPEIPAANLIRELIEIDE